MASISENPVAAIMELAARLSATEQVSVAHDILALALGVPLEAGKKARKAKDPSAPKREGNWWIKATGHVRDVLRPVLDAERAAGEKPSGTAPVRVASMLKDAGELSADVTPSDEAIVAAYERFKEAPPPTKKEGSTASSGSATKSSRSKYAGMSEEEAEAAKKAARSEAAKKAAATRAANKAKKAAEEAGEEVEEAVVVAPKPAAPAPAPKAAAAAAAAAAVAELEELDDEEPEKEPFTYKGKKYMSLPIEHHDKEMVGLWDLKGKWVGALETDGKKQTLHTDCDDPLA
jgi:hypothetical protein